MKAAKTEVQTLMANQRLLCLSSRCSRQCRITGDVGEKKSQPNRYRLSQTEGKEGVRGGYGVGGD